MDSTDLILGVLVTGILIFAVILVYLQNRNRGKRLAYQAEKRGGEIHKGGLFRMPELWIPFKETVLVIRPVPGSKYSSPKTIAQVKLDSPRFTPIRIQRNSLWQKAITAFGGERLSTGDEEFDSRWITRVDDPFTVQKIVTVEFKAKLNERILQSLSILIKPQDATFTIMTIPSNDEGYDQFIDTVLSVLNIIL